MKSSINDFLSFNSRERKGIIFLIILIVLLLILNENLHYFFKADEISTERLDSLKAELSKKDLKNIEDKISKNNTLFSFNPNTLSLKEWESLGLSKKQAQTLLNYLNGGGVFKVKSDLKKIYSVSDEFYELVKDSILLPDKVELEKNKYRDSANFSIIGKRKEKRTFKETLININLSDSSDWESLYGIGPTYSKRIINYRKSLGGFVSFNQLYEVWGINDTVITALKKNIILDTVNIQMMNINKLEASELKAHPYIDWNIANAIVKYRATHGDFNSISELKKIHIVKDTLYQKLEPYLTK